MRPRTQSTSAGFGMNTTMNKVAIACFLGAAIGALIALQLGPTFWWTGVLVGGIIGYLTYEFRNVVKTAKNAYTECKAELSSTICTRRQYRQEFNHAFEKALLLYATLFSWIIAGYALQGLKQDRIVGVMASMFAWTFFLTFVLFVLGPMDTPTKEGCRKFFYQLSIPIVLCWHIPRGIFFTSRWAIKKMPSVYHVCKRSFLYIHSEIRLLCMTDAMIGATIGYLAGNALIGGIAGAVCGVLNYELVSKRWLKLVPA